MGIGREVADAYIDVHGDLKKFRKDLEEAAPAGEQAGREFAETFSEGFGKRGQKLMDKQWSSMLDALYTGDKFDFGRMIDNFDPTDFENALEKIRAMGEEAVKASAIDPDDWADAAEQIRETASALKEMYDLEQLHGQAIAENNRLEAMHAEAIKENIRQNKILAQQEKEDAAWRRVVRDAEAEAFARAEAERMEKRRKDWEEAIRMNEAFERSFEGMVRRMNLDNLETDFKKIGEALVNMDFSKFAKNFDSFDDLAKRVHDVTDAMRENGRITEENAFAARFWTEQYIADQEAKLRAEQDALDAARELREEQERYKASLDGMVEAAHFQKVQRDYNMLSTAIGTADFSWFAKGAKSVDEFRDRVTDTANSMMKFGKITQAEFFKIIDHLDVVEADLDGFKVKLGDADGETRKWGTSLAGIKGRFGQIMKSMAGTVSHIRGLAGLNVFGDMIEQGLDIARNIDRVALNLSTAALKIGSATSIIATAAAGIITIGSDLAAMGNIAILTPAFVTGLGLAVGAAVVGFKDMKEVLKDLGPQFSALQDSMSKNFWKELEGPMRRMVEDTFPSFKAGMEGTATVMGDLFAEVADAIREIDNSQIDKMFGRLNSAIKTGTRAVKPLMNALGTLGEVGSQYFGRFAEWIVDLSERFDDFITKAAQDGRLNRWVEEAIDSFQNAGRAIGGVVEIFQGLNEAAEKAGVGGLKEFADSLERMADIAKSPEFQGPLTEFLQGARVGAEHIANAIDQRLFPALGSIAPTMATAMDIIGEAMGKAIGYVSDIIENPKVQEGVLALSNGIRDAMVKLEPAIKPIGDSLGSLLEISGHIVGNIADVFATFMVNFGPTIDAMGRKIEELADPLTGSVKNAIEELKPVIDNINTFVVTPLVDGLKKIAPEVDKFVDAAGPTLKNISETIGPEIKKFLETVLPNAVTFALEMGKTFLPFVQALVELLTPAFGQALDEVGAGFKNAAEGLKALRGEANDFDLLPQFKDMHDKVDKDWKATWSQKGDTSFWTDLGHVLFGGNIPDMGTRFMESWGGNFEGMFQDLAHHVGNGFQKVWKGEIFGDQPGKFFREHFTEKNIEAFDDSVNQWFEDNLLKPIEDGWNGFLEGLDGWWKDVKRGFQTWMSENLGFDSIFEDDAEVSVGGGAGSRSVGGKITPEMIGLGAPEEGWLQGTIDAITTSVSNFFTGLGENITLFGEQVKLNWDTFWGGLGTNIETVWSGITTTLSTWWTTITTNIGTWFAEVKLNWDTFWAQLPLKVQEVWNSITLWITTKGTEISTNLQNFATTVRTNWDTFWNTVNTKAQTIWNGITTWISTKASEIWTNISNFITTVRTNWDSFWNTVNTKVQTIWNTVTTWISTKAGEIKSNIQRFGEEVKTNWNNFWSSVRDKVTEWWGKIKTGVQDGIDDILEKARSLPGDAAAAVPATIDSLLQKGRDFAQGFINGISGMVGDIAAAARSFVEKAIAAAREAQNSASPSKVTMGLGNDFGDGYVIGVADKYGAAASAAEGLAEAALSGISTSKMYAAGVDAALGLADGLSSQAARIDSVMAAILPDMQAHIDATATGGFTAGQAAVSKTVIFEEGALQVEAKQADPQLVSSTVKDDLNDLFTGSGF